MRFENLPEDEAGRRMALKVEAKALAELLLKFNGEDASSFVIGTIHNEIELIDRCLEFGVDHVKGEQYEAAAKADHRTDI